MATARAYERAAKEADVVRRYAARRDISFEAAQQELLAVMGRAGAPTAPPAPPAQPSGTSAVSSREAQLEREKQEIVSRYARANGMDYQTAEAQLQAAARPPERLSKEDFEAIQAVARREGCSFEEVLSAHTGRDRYRYFGIAEKYDGAGGNPPQQPPSGWTAGAIDSMQGHDPAAPSREEVLRSAANPKPLGTINGVPAVVGGRVNPDAMDELMARVRERRRRGEDCTVEDVIREAKSE